MTRILFFSILTCLFLSPAVGETLPLRENGTIPAWVVAGPFTYDVQRSGAAFDYDFLMPLGGEEHANPNPGDCIDLETGKSVTCQSTLSEPSGHVDFRTLFDVSPNLLGVAYGYCQLKVEEEKQVLLKVSSNDGVKAWVNDKLVHVNRVTRGVDSGIDRVPVTLHKGTNRLLFKVDQFGGSWGLLIAVVEYKGVGPDQNFIPAPERRQAANLRALPLLQKTANRPEEVEATGIVVKVPKSSSESKENKSKAAVAKFISYPLILKTPDGPKQSLTMDLSTRGLKNVAITVQCKSWDEPQRFQFAEIPLGQHRFDLQISPITKTESLTVELQSDSETLRWTDIQMSPIRKWTMYLVQHAHTDIGYTRPQDKILPEHLQYIDQVLDYCDRTDDYPDDAKFRWTCEVSWTVQEYIRRRPLEQIQRLKQRVQEGRIEITGMYLNLSEIATESSLAASLQPLRELEDFFGCKIKSGMQNDVNGAAWCLPDYFQSMGIRYLTMGINNTRSVLPFSVPTPFWWESPAGKRILAYRADHYHTGNYWKVHKGDVFLFQEGLLSYLKDLERREYPFGSVAAQFSGYQIDNSPPAPAACDLVRDWNEMYEWPRLRIATDHEFLEDLESHHADELPVYRQSWPDWWTDGFGSAARETAASRQTHSNLQRASTLLSMASLMSMELEDEVMQRILDVQENLLFFDEHTFGAAGSVGDPMAGETLIQWGLKSSYVWEAVKDAALLLDEASAYAITPLPKANVPTVAVFNTLNWERDGLVELFLDYKTVPEDKEFCIIDSGTGESVPVQQIGSRLEGEYWKLWVRNIPTLGYKIYRIELTDKCETATPSVNISDISLENEFYSVTLNPDTGGISALVDKQLGYDLLDSNSKWNLGQFIVEQAPDRREFIRKQLKYSTLNNVRVSRGVNGPIWTSLLFEGGLESTQRAGGEIRLYHLQKRIDLIFHLRKIPIQSAEGIYMSFPFSLEQGALCYEAQGGLVQPGYDQIPGSSSDWNTVQDFVAVRSPKAQIVFGSDEIPLVQFGDLNLGKWQELLIPQNTHVYAWIMNNYWFTNFQGTQQGDFEWCYYLTSSDDTSNGFAERFGRGARLPLVGRIISPDVNMAQSPNTPQSVAKLESRNIVLIEARPSYHNNGIVLHLREIEGHETELPLAGDAFNPAPKRIDEVNVIEETIREDIKELKFSPNEAKFIRLFR